MSVRTHEARSAKMVVVALASSTSVTVDSAAQGVSVTVGCDDDSALESLVIHDTGDSLSVLSKQLGDVTYDVQLRVAAGVDLNVAAPALSLHTAVDLGAVRIGAASGDVALGQVHTLHAAVKSARISVTAIERSGFIGSASGDVIVDDCSGDLNIKAASADVAVANLSGSLSSKTASGDFTVERLSGQVDIRTSSGDVSVGVAEGLTTWLDLSSASGDVIVELAGAHEPDEDEVYAQIVAQTGSGDVHVYRSLSDLADEVDSPATAESQEADLTSPSYDDGGDY